MYRRSFSFIRFHLLFKILSLTSSDILLTNATIITGLIILLTLQSLTSPIWEKQLDDYLTDIRNSGIEIVTIQGLMEEYCNFNDSSGQVLGKTPEYQENCFNWAIRESELNIHVHAWTNFTKSLQLTTADNNLNLTPSIAARFATSGLPLVNLINIAMIVPFSTSSLVELLHKFRKTDGQNASQLSVYLTIIGFAILIVGFISILEIMQCANPSGTNALCSAFFRFIYTQQPTFHP